MTRLKNYLVLTLEAPLQSWGERARWTVRDTAGEPTKSGIVGLLAACLGWGPEQDERIAGLADDLILGVRVDRPGQILVDFHTVCGGVISAEGKIKRNESTKEPETVVSERYYLADAAFTVVLGAPDECLDRIEEALLDPVWPPYLGRKSCPPATPLRPHRVQAASLIDALPAVPFRPRPHERRPGRLRCVVDEPTSSGDESPGVVFTRQDVPQSLAARRYGFRAVREFEIPTPSLTESGPSDERREQEGAS